MKWLKQLLKTEPPEDWRLVKTGTPLGIKTHLGREGKIYIYLFESSKGNRCIQCKCTLTDIPQEKIDSYVRGNKVYMERIYRWLMGRSDPEILRYSEVEQEEVMHYLKGTISETLDDK